MRCSGWVTAALARATAQEYFGRSNRVELAVRQMKGVHREPHSVLHGDHPRRLHRRPRQFAGLAVHPQARGRRAAELRRFIADVGAMAMGSTTYEWILDHEFADKDPAEWKWPYDIRCWVFTHRQLPVVPDSGIEFTSAEIATVHEEMVGAAGDRNVWIVGGGDLAGQFADAGLLNEVIRLDRSGHPGRGRAAASPPDRAAARRGRTKRRSRVCKFSVVHSPA